MRHSLREVRILEQGAVENGELAVNHLQSGLYCDPCVRSGADDFVSFGRRHCGKAVAGPMPETVRDDVCVSIDSIAPTFDRVRMNYENETAAAGFCAQR